MRAVIQRTVSSSVVIGGVCHGEIGRGMTVLLGITYGDTEEDIEWLCRKIVNLRIFDDREGVMNLPIREVDGDILVISQFTLYASTKKGNRPSYVKAAVPDISVPLYGKFLERLENILGKQVKKGIFGADMKVIIVNDGPVTIVIDTKNRE